jgi:hypothetical protein
MIEAAASCRLPLNATAWSRFCALELGSESEHLLDAFWSEAGERPGADEWPFSSNGAILSGLR